MNGIKLGGWLKKHRVTALDELCKITKDTFEMLDKQPGMAIINEEIESWAKENKLLKKVLKEKWAKEQIEQQLNEMSRGELEKLLSDGITLKIFNLENPKLKIVTQKLQKLPDEELKLIESGKLYSCNYIGIAKFETDCALVPLYQKIMKMTGISTSNLVAPLDVGPLLDLFKEDETEEKKAKDVKKSKSASKKSP